MTADGKHNALSALPPVPANREADKALADKAWVEFVGFLREREARITLSRRFVVERVFERHDHFQAEELAHDLATGRRRVSRGTVYRTLALMVDAGLARQVRVVGPRALYERICDDTQHEHLVCDHCGRFIEFTDPAIGARIDAVCNAQHFKRRAHRVVVFGTCRECAEDPHAS